MVVREEFAAASAWRAVLPIAALVPLSWLLVGWIVGRVLRPLGAVTAELRRWGKAGTNPLSLDGVPDEILPLALATNDLVTRLQAQLEFRERFISDAAHELRTPLTALHLQARNLSGSSGSPEQAALIKELTDGVRRMSDMVGKLLQLARADASAPLRAPVPVDLGEALAASLQDLMPIAAEKGIDIGLVDFERRSASSPTPTTCERLSAISSRTPCATPNPAASWTSRSNGRAMRWSSKSATTGRVSRNNCLNASSSVSCVSRARRGRAAGSVCRLPERSPTGAARASP